MSDDQPTAEDLAKLRQEIADLKQAQEAMAKAGTAEEKREAREELADAEADFATIARKLGVSESGLRKAASDAKKQEQKDSLRPIIRELLEELVGEDDEDEKDEPDEKPEPKAEKAPREKPVPKDSEPLAPHFSDRTIAEFLR